MYVIKHTDIFVCCTRKHIYTFFKLARTYFFKSCITFGFLRLQRAVPETHCLSCYVSLPNYSLFSCTCSGARISRIMPRAINIMFSFPATCVTFCLWYSWNSCNAIKLFIIILLVISSLDKEWKRNEREKWRKKVNTCICHVCGWIKQHSTCIVWVTRNWAVFFICIPRSKLDILSWIHFSSGQDDVILSQISDSKNSIP